LRKAFDCAAHEPAIFTGTVGAREGQGAATFLSPFFGARSAKFSPVGARHTAAWPKVCAPPAQPVVGDRNVAAPWPPADSSRTNYLARVLGSSG
jgi:hypothetical protein